MENPIVKGTFDTAPALTILTTSSDSSSSPSPLSLSPTAAAPTTTSLPPQPPSPPPAASPVVLSPCAACKILRRRCIDKCVLAPYFPPTEPYKFTIAHRVFGASNIIKFLQELPESQRADAVSSMVYEANARLRDPVYGCAGAICHLQKQVSDLQAQLAKSQAELLNLQTQHTNLVALICMEMSHNNNNNITYDQEEPMNVNQFHESSSLMGDDVSSYAWDSSPVWA